MYRGIYPEWALVEGIIGKPGGKPLAQQDLKQISITDFLWYVPEFLSFQTELETRMPPQIWFPQKDASDRKQM